MNQFSRSISMGTIIPFSLGETALALCGDFSLIFFFKVTGVCGCVCVWGVRRI